MAFPSTNDYRVLPFCAPMSNHTGMNQMLDTGGHAKWIDFVVTISTVAKGVLWYVNGILNGYSSSTGAAHLFTDGIPAQILVGNNQTGQWKFRVNPITGDYPTTRGWMGPVEGRYVSPYLLSNGDFYGDVIAIVGDSDEYPVE